jgi:ABC superfamily ATP binding cassette transporter, ABC protein
MPIIELKNLSKTFYTNTRENFWDYFKFNSSKTKTDAVKDVSFSISKGETVGLIGLNGSGKSTLIKMMTGILLKSSGEISVLDCDPFKNRVKNNKKIATVFGQRCKLRWDISPMESFYLIRDMYDVKDENFTNRLEYFLELLDAKSFINNPVRTLSLGQRMKSELISALLYEPDIIFLDEPTIGLDIVSKEAVIDFIKKIKGKTTIIFTTHDFDDIEEVCDRIIIINKGSIIRDCMKDDIKDIYQQEFVSIELRKLPSDLTKYLDEMSINYEIENKVLKIYDKLEISDIYIRYEKNISSVNRNRISFKDSLKYFLKQGV